MYVYLLFEIVQTFEVTLDLIQLVEQPTHRIHHSKDNVHERCAITIKNRLHTCTCIL